MGGGEFVRAAAKMIGAGAVNHGVLGSPTGSQLGQLLRRPLRPTSVFVGSSSPVPPAKAIAGAEVEVVMKPMEEIDDREIAMEAAGPKPRIVFGGAPSLEEAMEATMEVTGALDRIYLSSSSSNSKLEAESCCLSNQTSPPTLVPQNAIQAFRLLKESAEAQAVVASIVNDTNVWNAMLSNEELKSFLQSYQTNKALEFHELEKHEESKSESRNVFHKTTKRFKTSIDNMLARASSFLRKVFGSSPAEVSGNDKATSGYSSAEIVAMGSIMGLVIVVIAVVVAKRN